MNVDGCSDEGDDAESSATSVITPSFVPLSRHSWAGGCGTYLTESQS